MTSPLRAVLYARVSTDTGKQDPETQLHALRTYAASRGWSVRYEEQDQVTGDPARRHRDPPGLCAAIRRIEQRKADVLLVFSVDRIVRSTIHLVHIVQRVEQLGGFVTSTQDGDIDTTNPQSEFTLFLRGFFAKTERKLISARTHAGLNRARASGKTLGRPRFELSPDDEHLVKQWLLCGHSPRQVASTCKISYRQVREVAKRIKNGGLETQPTSEGAEGA